MNRLVVHIMVDNVTDEEAIAIKKRIEDALKEIKKKEIEVSIRNVVS